MARFIVLGNCQSESLSRCLRELHSQGYVESHNQVNLRADFGNEDRFLTHLRSFDFVVLQEFLTGMLGVLDTSVISAHFKNAVSLPGVVFTAFHPDIVYARPHHPESYGHRFIVSPLGEYQSGLAVYGFLQGLTIEATCALFRREVYQRLGYLNMWHEAQSYLLNGYQQHGWNIEEYFLRWTRRGVFMHSSNHPKLYVCADIARMVLRRCDIAFDKFQFEDHMVDPLTRGPVWPVYPEIATALGLKGSTYFKSTEPGSQQRLFWHLEPFVAACYAELAKVGQAEIECARVQGWITQRLLTDI